MTAHSQGWSEAFEFVDGCVDDAEILRVLRLARLPHATNRHRASSGKIRYRRWLLVLLCVLQWLHAQRLTGRTFAAGDSIVTYMTGDERAQLARMARRASSDAGYAQHLLDLYSLAGARAAYALGAKA